MLSHGALVGRKSGKSGTRVLHEGTETSARARGDKELRGVREEHQKGCGGVTSLGEMSLPNLAHSVPQAMHSCRFTLVWTPPTQPSISLRLACTSGVGAGDWRMESKN